MNIPECGDLESVAESQHLSALSFVINNEKYSLGYSSLCLLPTLTLQSNCCRQNMNPLLEIQHFFNMWDHQKAIFIFLKILCMASVVTTSQSFMSETNVLNFAFQYRLTSVLFPLAFRSPNFVSIETVLEAETVKLRITVRRRSVQIYLTGNLKGKIAS